jgi:hypothetical protein
MFPMVGPLSSEEIEDVVSSVRRLVSNEQRPRTLSRDLNAERLLLTPALRVVAETSPLAPLVLDAPVVEAAEEAVAEAGAEAEGAMQVQAAVPPQGLPEADALAAPAAAQEAPPVQAPVFAPEPDAGVSDLSGGVGDAGSLDVSVAAEAEWEDEIWAEPGSVSLGEAALAADEAELLPSAPGPDHPGETAPGVTAPGVTGDDAVPAARERDGSAWVEDEPITFIPLRRRAGSLSEADAPAEKVAASGTAALPSAPEYLDEDGTPLAVLDEAALQEIVRQTLRTELQGELGERITRNVRKLVRAEINRALMARDLD